jgi:hypothetical protein
MRSTWWTAGDYIYAYTEDRDLMQSIRRYYPEYKIMAEYMRDGKLYALQYRIPRRYRRTVKRQFGPGRIYNPCP